MNYTRPLRIVFMGTPEFAVDSLRAISQTEHTVAGVVTVPDKPAGRGMKTQESAVKKFSLAHGYFLLQPERLRSPKFLNELKMLNADIFVVVAFRMLPEIVWSMPPLGTINLHASLLPNYRGAAPINWAIIRGEKQTGVTTFQLQQEIDTGNILMQKEVDILPADDAGILHDKLKTAGAELLVNTLEKVQDHTIAPRVQIVSAELKTAPKITTDNCWINFEKTADEVINLIRGLSPYPAAFSFLEGKKLKIFEAKKTDEVPCASPGKFHTDGKSYLRVAVLDGMVDIIDLQLEGRKRMKVQDFLRGYRFASTL